LIQKGNCALSDWTPSEWTRATLVSLPSIEPKANDNLISEKLAQSPENGTEPSPGEGYRWLIKDVDTLQIGDVGVSGYLVGRTCGVDYTYRRSIEPQADISAQFAGVGGPTQATMPKAASEIEKEAAIALLRETRKTLYSYSGVNEVQPAIRKLNAQAEKASGIVSAFERAEAYARAIGAIE